MKEIKEMLEMLKLMTALTKLKYGNLEPSVWEKIVESEKLIDRIEKVKESK
jgi:hypothetical protein